jgi:hypothetical protein
MIATKPSQAQRILKLLQEDGEVTNVQLNEELHIYRYGARIMELRRAGHRIESVHERAGLWKFKYTPSAPAKVSLQPQPIVQGDDNNQLALVLVETTSQRVPDGRGIIG